jgi:hypothetical protein
VSQRNTTDADQPGRAKVFAATTFPDPIASLMRDEMARTGETPASFLRRVVAAHYGVVPPVVERGGYRRGKKREPPTE